MPRKQYVDIGQRVRMEIGWSECAMSMRVAGRVMDVELLPSPVHGAVAQLFDDSGREYSAPILIGEAGLYRDEVGIYCYPEVRHAS